MKKYVKTAAVIVMSLVLLVPVFAGGGKDSSGSANGVTTLRFFSNLPDRSSNMGLLEQTLLDEYQKANPNVKIVVEALQDEPYKQKFKAYMAGNNLPDIFAVWGQPSFFEPVMKEGYAAELDPSVYSAYAFVNGSLNGFSYDGKLYGLPRNTDMMVVFYNAKLFADNGIAVPQTVPELIAAAKKFKAKGIAPISMDGKDAWPLAILYHDLVMKRNGDDRAIRDALAKKDFNSPVLLQAAKDLVELVDGGVFQTGFVSADYGASQNIFSQGKAAMYYMGSWEMGMATNDAFSAEFKENLAVMNFMSIPGSVGRQTDMMAWNSGGYAVSGKSSNKTEAVKLLDYMMLPENWTKHAWQQGLGFPGQKFDAFLSGTETDVQKTLVTVLGSATNTSGTPINDSATAVFKTECENAVQALAAKIITPEQFIQKLNDAIKK